MDDFVSGYYSSTRMYVPSSVLTLSDMSDRAVGEQLAASINRV
jgi:hypothetical protein